MVMQKRKLILLSCLFSMAGWAHEPKEGKVLITVAPYFYQTHNAINSGLSTPPLMGFGIIGEGDIDHHGGLEIALNYLQKIYSRRVGDLYNIEKTKRVHITMGYRHWFNPKFSSALGFFSAYSIGEGAVVHTDFPYESRPDSSANDVAEYGFDLSLLYEPWSKGPLAMIVDARYSYSVTNKVYEDGNHYGALVGFKYTVQEERIKPPRRSPKIRKLKQKKGRE